MTTLPTPGTLTVHKDVIQGTDEWHDQRRGMVTASAIGRLMTVRAVAAIEVGCPACDAAPVEPCRSKVNGAAIKIPHTERAAAAATRAERVVEPATGDEAQGLLAVLAAERISGHTDPSYISGDMLRGTLEEPFARDAYSSYAGVPAAECGFMVRTWDHNMQGVQLGYSPDGLVGDDGLIEVKSRRGKTHLQSVIAGQVPAANLAQIQCGLFVSGRQWCDYVSYCGGMNLWVVRVFPDPQWFDAIAAVAVRAEGEIEGLIFDYMAGVEGMPLTERIDLEMNI